MRHIIYIPGLGDGFDPVRKVGLFFWRRPGVGVSHVPMSWRDEKETYDEKLARIKTVVTKHKNAEIVFVGESAGGSMAIAAYRHFGDSRTKLVTVCGMNQGAGNVSPRIYEHNPAFRKSMEEADRIIPTLTESEKISSMTIYSSGDLTVRPRDTLLKDVSSYDLKVPQHNLAILTVLFLRFRLILNFR